MRGFHLDKAMVSESAGARPWLPRWWCPSFDMVKALVPRGGQIREVYATAAGGFNKFISCLKGP